MRRLRTFTEIEQAVLAAVFIHEQALALAPGLEIADFHVMLHAWIFNGVRNVEAQVGADGWLELHRCRDIDRMMAGCSPVVAVVERLIGIEKARRNDVDPNLDNILTASIGELVLIAPQYRDDFDALFPKHVKQLRVLANQRQQLLGAR